MINIKIARIRKGWSQQRLAEEIEVNRNDISRYETGRMKPSISNLLKLADALNVTTDYLLGRVNNG